LSGFLLEKGFFGLAVSEKIFLEINPSETKMACGAYVCKWIGTK
jgi:hypothetical protein